MNNCGCFGANSDKDSNEYRKNHTHLAYYTQRKRNAQFPPHINKYFQLLQETSKHGYKKAIKKVSPTEIIADNEIFYKNFDTLTKHEQHYYLSELIKQVQRRMLQKQEVQVERTLTIDTIDGAQLIGDSNKYVQTKCKYCSSGTITLGLIKNWKQIVLKLNKQKKRLTVKYNNTLFNVPLRSYLLRSQKQQHTLIMDSINEFEQTNLKSLLFKFKQRQKFDEFGKAILDIIVVCQVDRLMMEHLMNKRFEKFDNTKNNKINLYLTEDAVRKCTQRNEQFERDSLSGRKNQKLITKQELNEGQFITLVEYQNAKGNWYHGLIKIKDHHSPQTINFLEAYQNSHRYLNKFKILETANSEKYNKSHSSQQIVDSQTAEDKKYCAFYQKIQIGQRIYGQQVFLQKQRTANEQKLSFVNLDHALNQNFIDYLKVRLFSGENKQTHFMIEITTKIKKEYQDLLIEFITEFYSMFDRLRVKQNNQNHNNAEIFIGQMNSKFYISKDLISRFGEEEQTPLDLIKRNSDPSMNNMFIKRFSVENVPHNSFLHRKYRIVPTQQKIGKIMNEHFLYKQWERLPKGGLKCINYELVAFQKSLAKTVFKKFGETILKGKNIINFSLPVLCFKKQSHLQSIAQSLCYNPIHLQKAAKIKDPFERMKYSVIIMIAVGILTVQSEKPFNPILGQTYQGYVDGCPVYLEQISHHPPISAFYMVGRGYKMYGSVEPRISLGLNSATGYSSQPQYIEFDDGTIIELIFARITITGMILGDREFYFEDKIYAFDKKNNLFTQLIFGPIKTGLFSSSSQPRDYFHGKIYSVTDKFKEQFNKSSPRMYPTKNDIVREHLMFDGIWSGSVHMDGQEIINFKVDLPYQFVQEQYPIGSDSRYRKDLQKLVEGDKQEAQKWKETLQQEQRRDKKLRSQYSGKD